MDETASPAPATVRYLEDTPGVACPCGTAYRVLQASDGGPASIHVVDIRADSERHYHRTFTEIYTCLEGEGSLELDGSVVTLRPGTVVVIPPGVRHRAYPASSDETLRILNTAVPPFDATDEWLD